MAIIVEYWLADRFGRAWLRLRKRERLALAEKMASCGVVAHGGRLPAGKLWKAQAFAALMWFRVAIVIAVFLGVIAIPAASLRNNGVRNVIADVVLVLGSIAVISGAQMGMISYRRNSTHRHILRAGPQSALKVLEDGARGLPRPGDFWLILAITLAGSALIFYSASHPSA